jgi:Uma2 family endonuclease
MATVYQPLTLAEFEAQFAHQKPYYEFWNGEAIQKSTPNFIHGLLQAILMKILRIAAIKRLPK